MAQVSACDRDSLPSGQGAVRVDTIRPVVVECTFTEGPTSEKK